jgi:hypothetical protein
MAPRRVLGVMLATLAALLPASAAAALPAGVPAKPITRACALLRGPEIAAVLGANPGRGTRDRSYCRYEPLPDLTRLITGLFPDSGRETLDGARRVAEGLGGTVEDVAGVGTAAIWEPEKGQLSVATRRRNVFEVQIISDGDPAVVRQQAVDLAGVVLAHRRA